MFANGDNLEWLSRYSIDDSPQNFLRPQERAAAPSASSSSDKSKSPALASVPGAKDAEPTKAPGGSNSSPGDVWVELGFDKMDLGLEDDVAMRDSWEDADIPPEFRTEIRPEDAEQMGEDVVAWIRAGDRQAYEMSKRSSRSDDGWQDIDWDNYEERKDEYQAGFAPWHRNNYKGPGKK